MIKKSLTKIARTTNNISRNHLLAAIKTVTSYKKNDHSIDCQAFFSN